MEIKKVAIERLREWEKNPREVRREDLERLKRQIKRLGVYKPLVVVEDGDVLLVLGGNMRLRALREMGVREVEVSVVEAEDDGKRLEYSLSDNDRVGSYIEEKLARLSLEVKDEIKLEDYKVDLGKAIKLDDLSCEWELKIKGEELEVIEDGSDEEIEVYVKRGDIYELGGMRIMCGDSMDGRDLEALIKREKIDMILTDPPYGIGLNADFSDMKTGLKFYKARGKVSGNRYDRVRGDEREFEPGWIFERFRDVKEMFLWGAENYADKLLKGGSWLVWDKRVDEAMDKIYGSAFELCWSKARHKREIIRIKWAGVFGMNDEMDGRAGRWHPTQKPVRLAEWIMERYSKKGDVVLDLYLGAGWSVLAGERLGRRVLAMEIEERYVEIAIRRWCAMMGVERKDVKAIERRER